MSDIAKEMIKAMETTKAKTEVKQLLLSAEYYLKLACPIRSGNMLNHIKATTTEAGNSGKILISAYKYDEHIFKYSNKSEFMYYTRHTKRYLDKNLEQPRNRYNTYYGTGEGLERKFYPRGIVSRIKGISPYSNFNYASHTNDAQTKNKGWIFMAIEIAVNNFCVDNHGSIEKWNLH